MQIHLNISTLKENHRDNGYALIVLYLTQPLTHSIICTYLMYVQFLKCETIKFQMCCTFVAEIMIFLSHSCCKFFFILILKPNIVYVCYNWWVQRKAFCSQLLLCFSAFLSLTIFSLISKVSSTWRKQWSFLWNLPWAVKHTCTFNSDRGIFGTSSKSNLLQKFAFNRQTCIVEEHRIINSWTFGYWGYFIICTSYSDCGFYGCSSSNCPRWRKPSLSLVTVFEGL